ncbi:hypothetical protein [Alkalihalobacterium chitinilyticum]|uniref:Uncharacterized protein n=1 Tax=Alkalihalobacterium chitinilyticum TaxID=2980103 RepID=A0ABT5VKF1_9BACI|nr:hypothetical protein [Alkalihalobacterium chitinilyticum]MDE5415884.1 hypothetical protein [Alkalihalobacterium chitinilyticum]
MIEKRKAPADRRQALEGQQLVSRSLDTFDGPKRPLEPMAPGAGQ